MRLAQKTELRIAGSLRQTRIYSTRHALCCCRARLEPGEEGYTQSGCPGRLTSAMGPVPASWGVAGLDLACLCRRPGQLHPWSQLLERDRDRRALRLDRGLGSDLVKWWGVDAPGSLVRWSGRTGLRPGPRGSLGDPTMEGGVANEAPNLSLVLPGYW